MVRWPSPGPPRGTPKWPKISKRGLVVVNLRVFSVLKKVSKMEPPRGGGDRRSAHAGAGFVRVGRCRFGSILDSILE